MIWLRYSSGVELNLQGFSYLCLGGCVPNKKSTSECYFNLGFAIISWCSKKQSCVVRSTAEAEYVAACMAAKEVVWLLKLLAHLFGQALEPTAIMCVV